MSIAAAWIKHRDVPRITVRILRLPSVHVLGLGLVLFPHGSAAARRPEAEVDGGAATMRVRASIRVRRSSWRALAAW